MSFLFLPTFLLFPVKFDLQLKQNNFLFVLQNLTFQALALCHSSHTGGKNQPLDLLTLVILNPIDHFTVGCLGAWSLNENEAGGDLVLIETSLLFLCKLLSISMRTASLA